MIEQAVRGEGQIIRLSVCLSARGRPERAHTEGSLGHSGYQVPLSPCQAKKTERWRETQMNVGPDPLQTLQSVYVQLQF